MKKTMGIVILALVLGAGIYGAQAYSQMGSGMMGRRGGWGCGPGSMMMGPGGGGQYGSQYQQPRQTMEERDARDVLENYLKSTRNPNLKLGALQDKGSTFEAEILTKNGSLVDRIAVDKATGQMHSVY